MHNCTLFNVKPYTVDIKLPLVGYPKTKYNKKQNDHLKKNKLLLLIVSAGKTHPSGV